jgi:DNA-binding transcriptional regulator YhcF (GntR family)
MRFRIIRNGEVPIREQLVRQAVLSILSNYLLPGARLPSVRDMARRHRIHSNSVSAAWHDLLDQGSVELRRTSGLYVRPLPTSRQNRTR